MPHYRWLNTHQKPLMPKKHVNPLTCLRIALTGWIRPSSQALKVPTGTAMRGTTADPGSLACARLAAGAISSWLRPGTPNAPQVAYLKRQKLQKGTPMVYYNPVVLGFQIHLQRSRRSSGRVFIERSGLGQVGLKKNTVPLYPL